MLHAEAGRDANVLTHELQERVADAMGCAGDASRQRVETLMGDYFRHARADRPRARSRRSEPPGRRAERAGATRSAGTSRLPATASGSSSPSSAASRPSLWLEIFRLALADGCPVSEQALDCIEQNLDRYTADDFAGTEAERQQLRALFYPRPGSTRACPRCTTAGC